MPNEEKSKKKLKTGELELTNEQLETYLGSVSIANIRTCKSASAASKHKIFQVTMALTESPEAKAYQATKKDLFEREGEEIPENELQEGQRKGQKTILKESNPEGHAEMMELLDRSSDIIIKKPLLPMDEFEGCSEADFSGSAWIFDWRATAKEVRDIENPKKKGGKNK
ncbi:MAG: hypothetical protein GWN76_14665 [candidate division Zixibacteria bacterium]|nr:hypothetical protein [candidate division Zixibacteria bacterium]NIR65383.1 hypothetical protein [candidate division Zixibacteria bacterium]NIS47077.1 hypothetical protein [candidate division Zixibacteria bacterium]NIU15213.1 hypothetical protein [candidate division Zixibacteria bacterium]